VFVTLQLSILDVKRISENRKKRQRPRNRHPPDEVCIRCGRRRLRKPVAEIPARTLEKTDGIFIFSAPLCLYRCIASLLRLYGALRKDRVAAQRGQRIVLACMSSGGVWPSLKVEGRIGQKTPKAPRSMNDQVARLRGALAEPVA
jgi:hypothetical protein